MYLLYFIFAVLHLMGVGNPLISALGILMEFVKPLFKSGHSWLKVYALQQQAYLQIPVPNHDRV
jgi:hypothetical protein